MKFIIECNTKSAAMLRTMLPALLVSVEQQCGDNISILTDGAVPTVEGSIDRGNRGPKVYYRLKDAKAAPGILEALGTHTVIGKVFADVAKAHLTGKRITEKDIREARKVSSKAVQSPLQKLCAAGYIESVPLTQ